MASTASFQKFNLEKWAQALGDLNSQMALRSENEKWIWCLKPSNRSREDIARARQITCKTKPTDGELGRSKARLSTRQISFLFYPTYSMLELVL